MQKHVGLQVGAARHLGLWLAVASLTPAVGCKSRSTSTEPTGTQGTRLVSEPSAGLWASAQAQAVATLVHPEPMTGYGTGTEATWGRAVVVPLSSGTPRTIADKVPSLPGHLVYTADGSCAVAIGDYSVQRGTGTLRGVSLTGDSIPVELGAGVSNVTAAPQGPWLASIRGGALSLHAGCAPSDTRLVESVLLARFDPSTNAEGGTLWIRRRASAGSALLRYTWSKAQPTRGTLTAVATGVTTLDVSATDGTVAFQATSLRQPTETGISDGAMADQAPGVYLRRGDEAPRRVWEGTATEVRWSPDGKTLAFLSLPTTAAQGDLWVHRVGEAEATRIARRVARIAFASTGHLALVGAYEPTLQAGTLGLLPPGGGLIEVVRTVMTEQFSADGRYLIATHPVQTDSGRLLALSILPTAATSGAQRRQLDTGVAGVLVDAPRERVLYKGRCGGDEAGCALLETSLTGTAGPQVVAESVSGFEVEATTGRVLVAHPIRPTDRRSEGPRQFALGWVRPGQTPEWIESESAGEWAFVGGSLVWTVNEGGRPGLYRWTVSPPARVESR